MVASPCRNLCRLDEASGLCVGCARTLDEIVSWSTLDDGARRRVWALLPARAAQLQPGRPLQRGPVDA
jgi:uncharacterized protein